MEEDQSPTELIEPSSFDERRGSGRPDMILGGRYRLSHLIGSGGMAQVWQATDTVLGRQVAVKMLHAHLASDRNYVARFRAEARAAAKLSHQNIVGVFDTVSDGDHEAIVMELLAATTLRHHLDIHHELEVATTIRIAIRVLAALDAAHSAGLVHRDIKPSNILLCDDGRVKIADFGIAKIIGQTELTQTGSLIGTVAYLAPEQVADEPVDGRADLYALGIVIYECLTGTTPFRADTKAAMAMKRLHATPTDPRRLRPGLSPELSQTVLKALARNPDDRFSSAADLRAALLSDPVRATPIVAPSVDDTGELPADPEAFTRSERRWLYPALFLILIAVALTTIGLLLTQSAKELGHRPSSPTTTETATAIAQPIDILRATTFDPEGDGVENDSTAARVIDGRTDTLWRTEGYEQPGFSGLKSGVGMMFHLKSRKTVESVRVEGSKNGWTAELFVIDNSEARSFRPGDATAVGRIENFTEPATIRLTGDADSTSGSVVVLWITDLGSVNSDGRYRVELSEVGLTGHATR